MKKIKRIELHYEDGTIIAVPETQSFYLGTELMRLIGEEKIEWKIIKKQKGFSLKDFFNI